MKQNSDSEIKTRFASIDGESLMEKNLPRIKFLINSLLANGLSVIAGSPKVGKSWLVLDWCVRIAKGEDVWNLHTNSGTTLYLSLEDDESRLQDRLSLITDEVPGNIHFVTACSTLGENLEEQIMSLSSMRSIHILPISFCQMKVLLSMKSSQRKSQRQARSKKKEFPKGCSDTRLSLK